MLATLRACGALAIILPEVDALYGIPQPPAHHPEIDTGVHLAQALDYAAGRGFSLAVRYAILAHDLGKGRSPPAMLPRHHAHEARSERLAERLSLRLRVPVECRDIARLTARYHGVVHRAALLRPATLLDLFTEADAFRRPARIEALLQACEADALSRPGRSGYPAADIVREALGAVKGVDAGAIAGGVRARPPDRPRDSQAIAAAVRSARLAALREWKNPRPGTSRPSSPRPRRASRP
jgi:tRNA nucleotidyltransferase (CCA-adding enzyme)